MADILTTTVRMSFDLVGVGQDSDFAQTVLDELTATVHSLAPDTLARFGISATTEQAIGNGPDITIVLSKVASDSNVRQLNRGLVLATILADRGLDFDKAVAQRRYEAEALRSAGITLDISEAEPGFTGHLSSGDRLVFHKTPTEPDHITSVTVALGCTLALAISAGRSDDPDVVAMTLKAEGGTAIGVPTVAVPELRAAGLVL